MYYQKSGNKYHAKSTEYGGHVYHSKFEAAYAQSLDLAQQAGDIKEWERQVRLDLKVNGQKICSYYIDFIATHNDGSKEYIECKGVEMEVWKIKWRILESTFDTDFRQNPNDQLTVVKQTSWGPPRRKLST